MDTARLLGMIVWRTTVSGLLAGALLGGAYGALFLAVSFFVPLPAADDLAEALLLGVPVGLSYGFFFGALLGAPPGLVLGFVVGVLAALLTRVRFYPLRAVHRYRLTMGLLAAAASVIGGFILFPPLISWAFWPTVTDSETLDYWSLTVIPALIAGAAGWWISQRMTAWYEREGGGEHVTTSPT